MSMPTVKIMAPSHRDQNTISVPFEILGLDLTHDEGAYRTTGATTVTQSGERVWVETRVDGEVILSHKIDPNEDTNDMNTLVEEIQRIVPFTLPVTTTSREAIAAVVHAYVSNGRPEWG